MPLIHQALRRSADKFPDKEAVVCADRRLTYRYLDEASSRLAFWLRSIGVKKGDRVGIFSAKSAEEVIAIYAALKAGATFVPINPQFRERQLAHVISDCRIRVLLVHPAKMRILEKIDLDAALDRTALLTLDSGRSAGSDSLSEILAASSPDASPGEEPTEDDIASIIYTSGSTGSPKGVVVTQKIFRESTLASVEVLDNRVDDRLISATPLSFDGALSQLFTAVHAGGTLVQQPSIFPRDIVDTLLSERITGFHTVPSLWGLLLGESSPLAKNRYPDLRYVSIIGEVLPERFVTELKRLLPDTKLYVMYGTTEAFRSTYRVVGEKKGKEASVGRPFPGVQITVEDETGAPCAEGQIGEIVHRGAFVSPGYWGGGDVNAAVFDDGAVRTGDLGRLDEDGWLYFEGRRDALIKTQGFRVSPEEIEQCIYELDAVGEAVVIGVDAPEVGTQIKAVVVRKPERELSAADVTRHCRQQLPHYMQPAVIEFRQSLPRTANNKIQRSALV